MSKMLQFYHFFLPLCFFVSFLFCENGLAQNCENRLTKAIELYNSGNLTDIELLVNNCLNQEGFTEEELTRVLDLMVNVELTKDDIKKADEYMLLLLSHNPLFRPSENDTPEYRYYFAKFKTDPILRIGGEVGMNFSYIYPFTNKTTGNLFDESSVYSSLAGFNLATQIYSVINRNFEVNTGIKLNFLNTSYETIIKTTRVGIPLVSNQNNEYISPYNYANITIIENYLTASIPLGLTYGFDISHKKSRNKSISFHPIINLGMSIHYVLTHSFNSTKTTVNQENVLHRAIVNTNINLFNENARNALFLTLDLALGLRLTTGSSMIQISADYHYGVHSLRNKNHDIITNEISKELLFKYGYIENDFSLHYVSFQVSYLKSIFNPKKIFR